MDKEYVIKYAKDNGHRDIVEYIEKSRIQYDDLIINTINRLILDIKNRSLVIQGSMSFHSVWKDIEGKSVLQRVHGHIMTYESIYCISVIMGNELYVSITREYDFIDYDDYILHEWFNRIDMAK